MNPPIINVNQMPFHRNKSTHQRTLSFKQEATFGKQNYMLFHEIVTVFTHVSRQENIKIDSEFLFKNKGTLTKLAVPISSLLVSVTDQVKYLKLLVTFQINSIRLLQKIYVLGNYAVHLMLKIEKLLKKLENQKVKEDMCLL